MRERTDIVCDRILKNIIRVFPASLDDMKSERQNRGTVQARASAAWLMRNQTERTISGQMSFPRIARRLSGPDTSRDHTTIMNNVQQVGNAQRGKLEGRRRENMYGPEFRKRLKIVARRSRSQFDGSRMAEPGDVGFEPVL
ncbi:MAG: helix-turn-helix domain-containing protein [Patescibacteria group bacterium]